MAAVLIDLEQATAETQHEGAVDNAATDTRDELYDEVNLDGSEAEHTTDENDEELPEKYRGKSVAEIARMHTEAEKQIGKQSNEVGELRQAFDEFVQTSVAKKDEPVKVTEDIDFFVDPN